MKEILSGLKREDGIQVLWQQGVESKTLFFSYSDLIDMKINALDLLDNPKNYALDVDAHRIISKV